MNRVLLIILFGLSLLSPIGTEGVQYQRAIKITESRIVLNVDLPKEGPLQKYIRENESLLLQVPDDYRGIVAYHSFKNNVPLEIVIRIIQIESQWTPRAVSRTNGDGSRDLGMMQLNSRYLDYFVSEFFSREDPFDAFNPSHNIEIGVKYLRYLYETIGDWYLAVLSYNAGIGNVYRNTIPASSLLYVKKIMT